MFNRVILTGLSSLCIGVFSQGLQLCGCMPCCLVPPHRTPALKALEVLTLLLSSILQQSLKSFRREGEGIGF